MVLRNRDALMLESRRLTGQGFHHPTTGDDNRTTLCNRECMNSKCKVLRLTKRRATQGFRHGCARAEMSHTSKKCNRSYLLRPEFPVSDENLALELRLSNIQNAGRMFAGRDRPRFSGDLRLENSIMLSQIESYSNEKSNQGFLIPPTKFVRPVAEKWRSLVRLLDSAPQGGHVRSIADWSLWKVFSRKYGVACRCVHLELHCCNFASSRIILFSLN